MPRIFKQYFDSDNRGGGGEGGEKKKIFACALCSTHLALRGDNVISKQFRGKSGEAVLLNSVINIAVGMPEERELLSGLHTVADIHCKICSQTIGWTYIEANEVSQRYKENKYIIERAFVTKKVLS